MTQMKKTSIALMIGLLVVGCEKARPKSPSITPTPEQQAEMMKTMGKPAHAAVPGATEEKKPEVDAAPAATEEKPAASEEKKE
jgi:PBP1b-binding outer membrane lipoprotein LpoB